MHNIMSKDPAFLMYSKDWLEGTAEFMPDEKGVFIDLLCHQHQKGSLPGDTERLARLVGLSHPEFMRIWDVVKEKFIHYDNRTVDQMVDQMDNRLINRKLNSVIGKRVKKGRINTVSGTFAALLRVGNYTSQQKNHLKSKFITASFIEYEKHELTERLTEWITERLAEWSKSIGNIYSYKDLFFKVIKDNNIVLPEKFDELIFVWLKYKSEKGQTYKETGLKTLITTFLKDSNSDYDTGRRMLDYSMSKNYAGLFKEKINGTPQQSNQRSDKRVNDYWNNQG